MEKGFLHQFDYICEWTGSGGRMTMVNLEEGDDVYDDRI